MKEQKVIFLRGLPASGKTRWSKEFITNEFHKNNKVNLWKRINKDDLRMMLDNNLWSDKNEKFILKTRDDLILLALMEGYNLIIDDTNLAEKHLIRIKELIQSSKFIVDLEIKDFTDVNLETCIFRDGCRENPVGKKVITDMYNKYLRQPITPPKRNEALPDALICDLDGTLALIQGRNPYDASKCSSDVVNEAVAEVLVKFRHLGYKIIFLSGRNEKFRTETEKWLDDNLDMTFDGLFMRPENDTRKDSILKKEIYEREILGKYNVLFVMEDRARNCDMYRNDLGLTVFQVAEGNF
jgi:predicted kinase